MPTNPDALEVSSAYMPPVGSEFGNDNLNSGRAIDAERDQRATTAGPRAHGELVPYTGNRRSSTRLVQRARAFVTSPLARRGTRPAAPLPSPHAPATQHKVSPHHEGTPRPVPGNSPQRSQSRSREHGTLAAAPLDSSRPLHPCASTRTRCARTPHIAARARTLHIAARSSRPRDLSRLNEARKDEDGPQSVLPISRASWRRHTPPPDHGEDAPRSCASPQSAGSRGWQLHARTKWRRAHLVHHLQRVLARRDPVLAPPTHLRALADIAGSSECGLRSTAAPLHRDLARSQRRVDLYGILPALGGEYRSLRVSARVISLQSPVGHLKHISQQRRRGFIMQDDRELRPLGASALWSSRLVRRVRRRGAVVTHLVGVFVSCGLGTHRAHLSRARPFRVEESAAEWGIKSRVGVRRSLVRSWRGADLEAMHQAALTWLSTDDDNAQGPRLTGLGGQKRNGEIAEERERMKQFLARRSSSLGACSSSLGACSSVGVSGGRLRRGGGLFLGGVGGMVFFVR
ncbi:hypothetical protein DFH09DRAFT_1321953 [Mycena vulgaris]|nr:hypothetical protein DFH09DRAFT_1321953 [Mycena vulgaris]